MMMLYKYVLNSAEVLSFFTNSLVDANNLSDSLLKTIDFETGVFFTLIPEGSNLQRLYEFKAGVVLPQNPEIVTLTKYGKRSSYSYTPTIRVELSRLMENIFDKGERICIFDDIIREPDEDMYDSTKEFKYVNDNQVYYILKRESASCGNIQLCLKTSNAFWHSLCIISNADIQLNGQNVTNETFIDICLHAQMVFVGAYDGEGYIFWEKSGSDLFSMDVADHGRPQEHTNPHWHDATSPNGAGSAKPMPSDYYDKK